MSQDSKIPADSSALTSTIMEPSLYSSYPSKEGKTSELRDRSSIRQNLAKTLLPGFADRSNESILDNIPSELPEEATYSVILFSHDRGVFHALDDGLQQLAKHSVDLDWISEDSFDIDSVLQTDYDIFFVDYRFGSAQGRARQRELLEYAAAHPSTPPVILISSKDRLRLTLNALEAGVVDYVFRDELKSNLLERMLRYCTQNRSGKNTLYERRVLPDSSSITSALEYSLRDGARGIERPLVPQAGPRPPRTQAKLPFSTTLATSLLEGIPHPFFWKDLSGRYAGGNRHFAELLGATHAEELIGTGDQNWPTFPDSGFAELERMRKELIETGSTQNTLLQLVRPDGKRSGWYKVHSSPLHSEEGELIGTTSTLEDVSEYIRAQHALRDSESRLRKVLEHLPVAVWTIDSDLRLHLCNRCEWAPRCFDRAHTQQKLSLYDLFQTEDPDFRPVALARKALEGESVSLQLVQDDTEYLIQIEPYRDRSGRIVGAVGVTVNVSERLALEGRLQQSHKFESLAQLARGIAHDFNNLLVGIVGNAGLIGLELPNDSPARDRLSKITRAADCASDFTSQLLAYAGKSSEVREAVNLTAITEEMSDLLESTVSRSVALSCELAEDLPPIDADPTQVKQVVMNLITNASDSIGERKGSITLRTKLWDAKDQCLTKANVRDGKYLVLSVSDTGKGMDEKTKKRIFDPFYTTKASGRGLGLATVMGVVKSHRGFIELDSVPDEGTTFRVFFRVKA